jgi:CelD/BcsL family acetyltransferase involved in cellulose biosynthesis
MRHVLDVDRAAVVDYLTGDDAYKRDWMSHRRERVGVSALRATRWRARAQLMSNVVAAALKPARRTLTAIQQSLRRHPPTTPNT